MPYTIDPDNANEPTDLREVGLAAAEFRALKDKVNAFLVDLNDNVNFRSGKLFIDEVNARVGINTTLPSVALDVVGAGKFSLGLTVGGNLVVTGTQDITGATTHRANVTYLDNVAQYFGTDIDFGIVWNATASRVDITSFTNGTPVRFAGTTALGNEVEAWLFDPDSGFVQTANLVQNGTTTLNGAVTLTVDPLISKANPALDLNGQAKISYVAATHTALENTVAASALRLLDSAGAQGLKYFYSAAAQSIFHDAYHPNADTLTTARNIALSGDVSGNANFDGSANINIVTTIADNSHNHVSTNISDWDEAVQDTVGLMVSGNTENGIAVTYDDTLGKINFDVADFTITLGGDATGSIAINNLVGGTLTVAVVNDSHTHDTRYFTEAESDARFLAIGAKAADSNLLDGLDSTAFIRTAVAATKTAGDLTFNDNINLRLGTGADLRAFHDGTHSYFDLYNGNLFIRNRIAGVTETVASFLANAAVDLYYNGSIKFATTNVGAQVFGDLATNTLTSSGNATANGNRLAEVYGGSGVNDINFPLGHTITFLTNRSNAAAQNRNIAKTLYLASGGSHFYVDSTLGTSTQLSGTWRARGYGGETGATEWVWLAERVA